MKKITGLLEEITVPPGQAVGRRQAGAIIRLSQHVDIHPGQYFQVFPESVQLPLPQIAYAASLVENERLMLDSIPDGCSPGDSLHLWGPLGKGFSLPGSAHFVSLACPEGGPLRLLPMISLALTQRCSVSLFMDLGKDDQVVFLPFEVEVQPLAALPASLAWANILYMDMSRSQLPQLPVILGLSNDPQNKICPGQVLVRTEMPCIGIGACGVCGVETRHGFKLACKDGPVFNLEDLIHVV